MNDQNPDALTDSDLSNLRTLVSLSGGTLQTGSKLDKKWLDMRDHLYEKLGHIRDDLKPSEEAEA